MFFPRDYFDYERCFCHGLPGNVPWPALAELEMSRHVLLLFLFLAAADWDESISQSTWVTTLFFPVNVSAPTSNHTPLPQTAARPGYFSGFSTFPRCLKLYIFFPELVYDWRVEPSTGGGWGCKINAECRAVKQWRSTPRSLQDWSGKHLLQEDLAMWSTLAPSGNIREQIRY